jgi:lipid II isoglutaminyl synthase (glutamine-hydrolysing)
MHKHFVTLLGKTIRHASRLRGGGTALPGLVVEKIDPTFTEHALKDLPLGVVVVSGTNGKTTTTKMVAELLRAHGLKVFTNRSGSNFNRGVIASLLSEVGLDGKLHADIAVLELDEAHAVAFVDRIKPKYSLILNVMRDQLDRFGEVDRTANLLRHIALATTEKVVLNREDPQLTSIAHSMPTGNAVFFGLSKKLKPTFPCDDNLHHRKHQISPDTLEADVVLESFSKQIAHYNIGEQKLKAKLQLNGIYNVYNTAAAITLARAILGSTADQKTIMSTLSGIQSAFGRGEIISLGDTTIDLVLVKNPSGFQLGLKSFKPTGYATMIAINDNYADGRDMSWLWDVDFSSLGALGVDQISGNRAYDMALRLKYDEVPFRHVDTNIKQALRMFIQRNRKRPMRIYCTYTAMLTIRRQLSKLTKIEAVR